MLDAAGIKQGYGIGLFLANEYFAETDVNMFLYSLLKTKLLHATGKNPLESITNIVREAIYGTVPVVEVVDVFAKTIEPVRLNGHTLLLLTYPLG